MRELTDVIWYGAFDTYRDLAETIDEKLAAFGITDAEWNRFQMRRDVERSLEKAGADGILLKDLADYHNLQQQDVIKQLGVLGAAKGEDGRFRWLPAYTAPASAWQTQLEMEQVESDHRRLAFAAMEASYRNDHRTVVKALTAVRDGLTAGEQARLTYACKRLGSKRPGRRRIKPAAGSCPN